MNAGPPARAPGTTTLLVDAMCGRLATYLRMCGYDAAYTLERAVEADGAVLALAREEGRTLVTRDRALARRAGGVALTSRDVEGQLRELHAAGFELSLGEPTRCSTCNGRLERLGPDAESRPEEPDPGEQPVWACLDCGQRFWRGSHWDDVAARLDRVRDRARD